MRRAHLLTPLNNLTKKRVKWHWGPEQATAFDNIKRVMAKETLLFYPDFNKEFGFIVASAIVVYDDISYMNATIEKQFTGKSLKRCSSLEEAIHWVQNLDEFKI